MFTIGVVLVATLRDLWTALTSKMEKQDKKEYIYVFCLVL